MVRLETLPAGQRPQVPLRPPNQKSQGAVVVLGGHRRAPRGADRPPNWATTRNVLPPGLLTWLATRPVLESKRLPELIISQARYIGEPSTWCRLAPLAESDEIVVFGRVWRRASVARGVTAEQEGIEQREAARELSVPEQAASPPPPPILGRIRPSPRGGCHRHPL